MPSYSSDRRTVFGSGILNSIKSYLKNYPRVVDIYLSIRRILFRIHMVSGDLLYPEMLRRLAEGYLERAYMHLHTAQWNSFKHPPEWFDHRIDLFTWHARRNPLWVERGVFSREVMRPGDTVLDLCCGDGFFSHHLYSLTASDIDAIDRDPRAIRHGQTYHPGGGNIHYRVGDILTGPFPRDLYDVIIFDAAIEHFSYEDQITILQRIAKSLKPDGVLNGYTIVAQEHLSHPDHGHEFASPGELAEMLRQVFPHVGTIETIYPERHNIYFRASFDPERLQRFHGNDLGAMVDERRERSK